MFGKVISERSLYYKFVVAMLLVSFISAAITFVFEYDFEGSDFKSISDLFFWWFAAMTTVGAGIAPVTEMGRLFGIITMVTGALFYLGVLTDLLIWAKNKADEKFSGSTSYRGSNHILIIGYNNLAIGLINLLERKLSKNIDIVLVTNKIENNPVPDRVRFVKIHPSSTKSLEKISVNKASVAFVLSDEDLTDRKADVNALLLGGMIEELQRSVFTMVELNNEKSIKDFELFKIDQTFTFEELLKDLKDDQKDSTLLKKIPKNIREGILAS
ncbi:MAG: hypothetical protein Kow0081_0870 [Candidatus Dojkabacteria bacterium]